MNDLLTTYQTLKSQYPATVLLIRHEQFYVAIGDDALILEGVCDCRLNLHDIMEEPLAAIRRHALQRHVEQLLKAGYVVAVADGVKEAPASTEIERITMPVSRPDKVTIDADGEPWAV